MPETSNYLKHSNTNPIQRFLIDNFYRQLIHTIKTIKPKKILDVGCGEGFTLIKLKHAKAGESFLGIDSSDSAIALGKKLYPGLNIKKGDIYKLPYQNSSFDLVVCTEVLEHLRDPKIALAELKRVSNKYIALSVPNEPLFMIASFLKRGKDHPEHINHWTAPSFKKFLRANGLKISVARHPFPWTLVLVRK